jgi:hypothetical protein
MRSSRIAPALALFPLLCAATALSQQEPVGGVVARTPADQPKHPMTFFVTSANPGKGGDLGGLAGADAYCKTLATAVGQGNHDWRAYLSTQGANAANARDRIGAGPWYNAKGVKVANDVADLHGDTVDLARKGNLINKATALTEKGEIVPGEGDKPNNHDALTGSQIDGRAWTDDADHTCHNWTSGDEGSAYVGHIDRTSSGFGGSWNATHGTRGCSLEKFRLNDGAGLFYCFAADSR